MSDRGKGPTDGNRYGDSGAELQRLVALDKSVLPTNGGEHFNRLIFASSPYLLQHAENPVDWYPWGDEAFALAKKENKPVFLSIGYATCHWCHVMAHESFEDRDVAAVLNRLFVPIKVDREERPDIDDRYMTVSRLMTGSGGWPLNVFLTPEKVPFLTATYIPRTRKMGMPGVIEFLENVAALWNTRRDRIEQNCMAVMAELERLTPVSSENGESAGVIEAAFRQLEALYDPEWGGFGGAPKFPMPGYLGFLLRYGKTSGNPQTLDMVGRTLRMMRRGGVCDQVGFGIHRYSVDRQWLVPHFEKMLYDQALIAAAALEACQATGEPLYGRIAEEIMEFVLRELTTPEGGFYSALDADSEGEEGTFYLWGPLDIREVLGEEEAAFAIALFGVTEKGNFEGKNILHLPVTPGSPEGSAELEAIMDDPALKEVRKRLLAARQRRIRPLRDEKVLTSWNGLMIAAFARGYAIAGSMNYLVTAETGVRFIRDRLTRPDGRLMRSTCNGEVSVPAFLEDYAGYVHGLIALYEATLDSGHLADALRLTADMLRLFGGATGGLYDTGSDAETVLVRTKSVDDGVIPSGNSLAAMNLLRLGRIVRDDAMVMEGDRLLRAFMGNVAKQPAAYLNFLAAVDFLMTPPTEITFVGRRNSPETAAMLREIGRRFIPGLVLRFEGEESALATTSGVSSSARLCAAGACHAPVSGVVNLKRLLDEILIDQADHHQR
jgi:uncharacterized protein